MSYLTILFLGLVQGLAEFLPVSSSGHLSLLQLFTPLPTPPLLINILLHLATLLAVVIYFRSQLHQFFTQHLFNLTIATLPAAIVGFFLYQNQSDIFSSPLIIGLSFLLTSILLFSTRLLKSKKSSQSKIKPHQALIIGLFQALAILPGVSRSGATIVSALWLGITPQTAFQFSFLLSIPAILGALGLSIPDLANLDPSLIPQSILAFLIALTVGLASLKILNHLLQKKQLHNFAIYTFILSLLILGLFTV